MRTQGGIVQGTNSKSGHVDCTDKKENQIFVICKQIEKGAVAKSYMTNGLLINSEIFAHVLIRKPFLIYDFALNFLI
jgi:hypothetical protein